LNYSGQYKGLVPEKSAFRPVLKRFLDFSGFRGFRRKCQHACLSAGCLKAKKLFLHKHVFKLDVQLIQTYICFGRRPNLSSFGERTNEWRLEGGNEILYIHLTHFG
jgi:hypothetical protein